MGRTLIKKITGLIQLSETRVLILLSVFVGLFTALGAIGFVLLIEYSNSLFFGLTDQILTTAVGFANWGGYKLWLPLIPMLGGLLVGPIVYRYATEAKGHGVPEVMNAVARLGGIIGAAVAFYLAREKHGQIVLVEKEPFLGSGSTAKAAGGIRAQFENKV
ncbi:unnamed protein product, partial [marine sediment metagenome]